MSALLSTRGLTVRRGARDVVRDVTLEVSAGEIVALLGPNGAGKSTLLRAALGLVPIAAGEVRLGALDPLAADRRAIARAAALLPEQAGAGSELTVHEVVRTGRYAHVGALGAETDADRAAVASAIAAMKLEPLADRSIDALSAGERKRALVARCFAQEAPLLALDEPTSTLDAGHARALFDAIRARVKDGAGALVAMHDLALAAAAADRVIAMSEGAVVASGAPAEVLREDVLVTLFGARGRVEVDEHEVRLSFRR